MQHLLEKLNQAQKAITVSDLGESKLVPQQQNRFIRTATQATPILDEARRIDMTSHTRNIDRISLTGRMLRKTEETESAKDADGPDFHTNKLVAEELTGVFGLTDQALEDNIERNQLQDTIVTLAGERAGIDLADLFLNGDENSSDDLLGTTDGWLKKAANRINADDFDPADIESMFGYMISVLDKSYLRDPAEWTIWTDWDTADHYRDILRGRDTGLGDRAQTEFGGIAFKGFVVRYDAAMPAGTALLVPDGNRVWGAHRDVRIESERQARMRRTDFVVSLRADCHYEDENAAVVAEGFTGESGDGGAGDDNGDD